jgi:hypothetical protein
MSGRRFDRFTCELREVIRGLLRVAFRHIDTGADGGGAHVDRVEMLLGFTQRSDLIVNGCRERVELLPDGHRNGILQLRASHLECVDVLIALRAERG